MFKKILFLSFAINVLASSKIEWSYCAQSIFEINSFDVGTMPILTPSQIPFSFNFKLNRDLKGPVKTDVKIVRTVSGLSLPISCYLTSTFGNFGSCVYPNFCLFLSFMSTLFSLQSFDEANCPQEFLDYGFDCKCPFSLSAGEYNFNSPIDIPDLSTTVVNWAA